MEVLNKCEICNKVFSSRQSKWNHKKKIHKNDELCTKSNNKYICNYCNNIFSSNISLCKHKLECNLDKQTNNCKKKYLTKSNSHLKNGFIEKININSNIINIQNITINSINNANINSFKLLDICDIFEKEFDMILKLIERTYFNSNIKENHTFYVSNLQGQYLNVYDEQLDTTTKIKKYFFDELFSISLDRIKTLYNGYKNRLFEIPKQVEIQEKIAALEEMRNENNHTYKSYLKLINILAYDKKDLVINTWTKLKQLESLDENKDLDEIIWDRNISFDI